MNNHHIERNNMEEGYYFYSSYTTGHKWSICWVKSGYIHFFGQVSQKIGNEFLSKYVKFGEKIVIPQKRNRNKKKNIKSKI